MDVTFERQKYIFFLSYRLYKMENNHVERVTQPILKLPTYSGQREHEIDDNTEMGYEGCGQCDKGFLMEKSAQNC